MFIITDESTIYSANNSQTQINVTGWKTAQNDTNYEVKYNNELVSVTIHVPSGVPYTTTIKELGAEILKDGNIDLRPKMPLSYVAQGGNIVGIRDNSYKVFYVALKSDTTGAAYAHFTYKRR